nr:putative membrane protein [Quercus suber]
MVKSFGVAEADVGKYAGFCSAVFSLAQALVGVPWGRFSDVHGRKFAILIGLTSTMITTLLWGFSTSLPMAITARALQGMGNGNVGTIRTIVAEMVPHKELQPRAFSIMPLIWSIGSIFGPAIGGALANPYNVKPGDKIEKPRVLEAYPYALPNIVSACFFAFGIINGLLFLEETLESLHGRRDWTLRLGDKLIAFCKSIIRRLTSFHRADKAPALLKDQETQPLLRDTEDAERAIESPKVPQKVPQTRPSLRDVLSKQSMLNLTAYALLATHSMAFDQVLAVFLAFPALSSHGSSTTAPSSANPLHFAAGFGLDHYSIGAISTASGIAGMVIQFAFFPLLVGRIGILRCFRICALLFPVAYLLLPFTVLLPSRTAQLAALLTVVLLKALGSIFSFPCSTILLTNSAASLRVLGTLNGLAVSVAAAGRALGPAAGGAIFTAGVKAGYGIAPWWLMAGIAVLGAVPVFYLVEGKGFGGDDVVEQEGELRNDQGNVEGRENWTDDGYQDLRRDDVIKQRGQQESAPAAEEARPIAAPIDTDQTIDGRHSLGQGEL